MMIRAAIIVARSTTDTIDGAPNTQTPSQAEHGLGGRIAFWGAKARKSPKRNMAMELHILIVQRARDFPGRTCEQAEVFICME
jgi:hypothetical protein